MFSVVVTVVVSVVVSCLVVVSVPAAGLAAHPVKAPTTSAAASKQVQMRFITILLLFFIRLFLRDPAGLIYLAGTGNGQGVAGNIVCNGGTGSNVCPVAHFYRCHQVGVAADKGAVADLAAALVLPS